MKNDGNQLSENENVSEISKTNEEEEVVQKEVESLFALYAVQSSSLSVVSTNLPSETEDKLQQVLLQKQKNNEDPNANNSGMFRLKFSSEVESLFSKLESYVDKQSCSDELQNWYQVCVEYVSRIIKHLSLKDLATILEVALRWGQIKIENVSEPLASDLLKFMECCTFSLLDHSPSERPVLATLSQNSLNSVQVEVSPFSQTWANDLIVADASVPVKVRQTIELYKLKGIQDLNTLKRHIKNAVNDYYCLYQTHLFLSKSGYPLVLLQHASSENDTNTEDLKVISILKDHLTYVLP